jgi:hypothetical protein
MEGNVKILSDGSAHTGNLEKGYQNKIELMKKDLQVMMQTYESQINHKISNLE